ncbi:uncharacterized protein LODBEIA_P07650 [Lodderomyces beijingensis]|uniref:BAG domain-containing protein n=1 Tax=Lodderomyces beijingensis TaxID=1775926 RepID=A0ABP0ZIA7_9ASCO
MDQLKTIIPTTVEEVQHYIDLIKDKIPTSFKEIEPHLQQLQNITAGDVVDDFKNLKINPVTVSLTLVSLTTLFILGKLFSYGGGSGGGANVKHARSHYSGDADDADADKPKRKSTKKRLSKAQKANKEIQEILDFVELNYVPDIDKYVEDYARLTPEEQDFKFKYFDEMLLKETMKLDGIDVNGNEILRENRKKVIKFIQDHQRRLDKFRKEVAHVTPAPAAATAADGTSPVAAAPSEQLSTASPQESHH